MPRKEKPRKLPSLFVVEFEYLTALVQAPNIPAAVKLAQEWRVGDLTDVTETDDLIEVRKVEKLLVDAFLVQRQSRKAVAKRRAKQVVKSVTVPPKRKGKKPGPKKGFKNITKPVAKNGEVLPITPTELQPGEDALPNTVGNSAQVDSVKPIFLPDVTA